MDNEFFFDFEDTRSIFEVPYDKNISNYFFENLSQLSTGEYLLLAGESEKFLEIKDEETKNQNDVIVDQTNSCNNNIPKLNDFIPPEEENQKNQKNLNNFNLQTSKKGKSIPLPERAQEIYKKVKPYYGKKIPEFFRIEGIKKKHKSRCLKWIKKILDEKANKLFGKKTKFQFLNQTKIKKVNIKLNFDFLRKSPYEIYIEDSPKNKELMQELKNKIILMKDYGFFEFLFTPLECLFGEYLKSTQYKKDYEYEKIKYSDEVFIDEYLELYEIFADNFVFYFTNTLPNAKFVECKKCEPVLGSKKSKLVIFKEKMKIF
jgi:hypothetical protein